MKNLEMLHPVFALVAWTFLVLLLIPFVRIRSVRRCLPLSDSSARLRTIQLLGANPIRP
jgi:hypothetical protein